MEIFECMFDKKLLVNDVPSLLCEIRGGTQECVDGATDDWNKLVAFDTCLIGKATAPAFRALDSGAGGGSLDATSPLDGSVSDSAVSPLPDGGCNSLENTAPPVEITNVAAPLPSLGGGKLVPGTYFVTKFETYTGSGGAAGPTGAIFQETAILTKHQVIFAFATGNQDAGPNPVQHVIANYVVAGTSLTVDPLCGLVGQIVEPYAVASPSGGPTTLTVIVNGNNVLTLTKQ